MSPTCARALEAFENDRIKSQLNLRLVSELCRDRDNPMAELPTPNTSDIVAKQQRIAIERTEDQVLRLKLRQAYFHYLGSVSYTHLTLPTILLV